MYECLAGIEAQQRVNDFRAVANAISCVFADKSGGDVNPILRADLVEAYLAAPDPAERARIQVVSR